MSRDRSVSNNRSVVLSNKDNSIHKDKSNGKSPIRNTNEAKGFEVTFGQVPNPKSQILKKNPINNIIVDMIRSKQSTPSFCQKSVADDRKSKSPPKEVVIKISKTSSKKENTEKKQSKDKNDRITNYSHLNKSLNAGRPKQQDSSINNGELPMEIKNNKLDLNKFLVDQPKKVNSKVVDLLVDREIKKNMYFNQLKKKESSIEEINKQNSIEEIKKNMYFNLLKKKEPSIEEINKKYYYIKDKTNISGIKTSARGSNIKPSNIPNKYLYQKLSRERNINTTYNNTEEGSISHRSNINLDPSNTNINLNPCKNVKIVESKKEDHNNKDFKTDQNNKMSPINNNSHEEEPKISNRIKETSIIEGKSSRSYISDGRPKLNSKDSAKTPPISYIGDGITNFESNRDIEPEQLNQDYLQVEEKPKPNLNKIENFDNKELKNVVDINNKNFQNNFNKYKSLIEGILFVKTLAKIKENNLHDIRELDELENDKIVFICNKISY